jgi:hypothetical protein
VAAATSQATVAWSRWDVDPVFYVECAAGARVHLGPGEHGRAPCTPR